MATDSGMEALSSSPQHGFRGYETQSSPPLIPRGLTIAISREAGARGGTIGRRVARQLAWQLYDQELLEYLSKEGDLLQELDPSLREPAREWMEQQQTELRIRRNLSDSQVAQSMSQLAMQLAVQGNCVVIGRGVGFLLPPETTLHVRLVSPLEERVPYLSQWLRLTPEEARERAIIRDARRAEHVKSTLNCQVGDVYEYDLVLCSSRLGEDLCVELMLQAASVKILSRWPMPEEGASREIEQ